MKKIIIVSCGSLAATALPGYLLIIKSRYKQADIQVVLTKNATYFLALGAISHLPGVSVFSGWSDDTAHARINHADLVNGCDLFIVLPATANFLGKVANGIADDLATTCFIAYDKPKIIFPSMNNDMLHSKYVQRNISSLRAFGDIVVIGGEAISVATGNVGVGALPDIKTVLTTISSFHTRDVEVE